MKPVTSLLLVGVLIFSGCSVPPTPALPDEASMNVPPNPKDVLVLPKYPTPGKKYLVERDGMQEVWLVKDGEGTIEFVDPSTQQLRLSIQLGPCFSFADMPREHNFAAAGAPAYHTVPPDCRVWDGRTWTQTYKVQMPRLPNPCFYAARREAKVKGPDGDRLVTSASSVDITGPGIRGGYVNTRYTIVYSEKLNFFKELSPGYIGRNAIIIRELKE